MSSNTITLFGDSRYYGWMNGPTNVAVSAMTDADESFPGVFSSPSMAADVPQNSVVHSGSCVADIPEGMTVTTITVTVTLNPGASGESAATMVLGWNSAMSGQVVSLFAMGSDLSALISSSIASTSTPIALAGANAVGFGPSAT